MDLIGVFLFPGADYKHSHTGGKTWLNNGRQQFLMVWTTVIFSVYMMLSILVLEQSQTMYFNGLDFAGR